MVFNVPMATDTHDNDNEPLSFLTLRAATQNVLQYLQANEKKDGARESEPTPENRDEQKRGAHSEYVEHRLRDLATFERRAAGIDRIRRKRD